MREPLGHVDPRTAITRRDFLERGALLGAGLGVLGGARASDLAAALAPRDPLAVSAARHGDALTLGNAAITAVWDIGGGTFRVTRVTDHVQRAALGPAAAPFTLRVADGPAISADGMRIVAGPRIEKLPAQPGASRLADRSAGSQIVLTLRDASDRVEAEWRAVMRAGARYVR